MTRRREFICVVAGAAATWPLAAYAQEPGKVWRMGFLAQGYEKFYDALFDGLKDLGYQEGRNLVSSAAMPKDARNVSRNLPPRWCG
jgi:putative tryptophan/tyrosine transport system substrate-binding protein